jgi:hypothetical protein
MSQPRRSPRTGSTHRFSISTIDQHRKRTTSGYNPIPERSGLVDHRARWSRWHRRHLSRPLISGFMLKDAPAEAIVSAVRLVARGQALLAPAVTRAVIEELAGAGHARSASHQVSPS